jgi:hypothetical protein
MRAIGSPAAESAYQPVTLRVVAVQQEGRRDAARRGALDGLPL